MQAETAKHTQTAAASRQGRVNFTIDGRVVEATRGTSVLAAAREAGIYIPHLCDYPGLSPYAGCRLCLVEIEGRAGFETSCTAPVSEGMIVRTNTPELRQMQRNVLEVILADHPDRCLTCLREERCPSFGPCIRDSVVTTRCVVCPKHGNCDLQRVADFLGMHQQRFLFPRQIHEVETSNPFLERNMTFCIQCTRCTRVCDEVRGVGALGLVHRSRDLGMADAFAVEL
ncbi:MAG: 2Fe-2S iron-sulfur cluster-binding protein, partial [Chloroflexota bacterium]